MKIIIDCDGCMSNAQCTIVAPEIFEIREDGLLYVLQEEPPEALRAKVDEAVLLCPTQAISVEG